MKKIIALLLTAAMLVSLAGCGNSESTNIPADSDSTVESTEIESESEGGQVLGESTVIGEKEPDVNRNPIRSEFYNEEGVYMGNVNYLYDSQGNLVQRDFVWLEEYGGTTETLQYEYDADGNMTAQHQSYSYSDTVDTKTYTYADGRLTESTEYGYTSKYSYDDKGQLVEVQVYWEDGTAGNRTAYSYDSQGRKTKQEDYYSDGELGTTVEWKYNPDGTVAEQIETYGEWGTGSYKYYYNENQQLTKTESYTDDQHMYSLICNYDEHGRMTVEGTVMWDWKFNGYYKHFYE